MPAIAPATIAGFARKSGVEVTSTYSPKKVNLARPSEC
jgi:hypothetical protein